MSTDDRHNPDGTLAFGLTSCLARKTPEREENKQGNRLRARARVPNTPESTGSEPF